MNINIQKVFTGSTHFKGFSVSEFWKLLNLAFKGPHLQIFSCHIMNLIG